MVMSILLKIPMPSQGNTKSDSCCNVHILEMQPIFVEQKSLVQEVIKEAGHLCIVLPKSHCELNFIEFFWGTVVSGPDYSLLDHYTKRQDNQQVPC